jgi:hypothetical protein
MPRPEPTEIRIDERGDENHESWLLIRANHVTGPLGAWLFDSEIPHQRYIVVTITRCSRKRDLNHDWLHNGKVLLEMSMSQAQWGAFVSSFGQGTGVPATLTYLLDEGHVPQAPAESRFDKSHAEVRESGAKAIDEIQQAYDRLKQEFETGGKRSQREALRSLGFAIQNGPANMEFAAESLTEHVEQVVAKARADVEGMVLAAVEQGTLTERVDPFALGSGDKEAG